MSERQLHFWVGLFCLCVVVVIGVMVFQFGKLGQYLRPRYAVSIHFDETPGLFAHSPVMLNGITIGSVREVKLDEQRGGVLVIVEIEEKYRIRSDSEVYLRKSLLGDSSLEFTPGLADTWIEPGALLTGYPPADPMELVADLQGEVTRTLTAFNDTSREWQTVGSNINNLLDTNQGNINEVLEQTAVSLQEFTGTMKKANRTLAVAEDILADPQYRENLRNTLAALPQLAEETRETIAAVKLAVGKVDSNLDNLNEATLPLAKHSKSMVIRLDNTLANMQVLSAELATFAQLIRKGDGSLKKLVDDPELYDNLNRSAIQLATLLRNSEPVVRDLRIFSDKVARHPEIIGVSGALSGSSGLKEESEFEAPTQTVRRPGLFRQ